MIKKLTRSETQPKKVLTFRFASNDNLQAILSTLEDRFLGLDRPEIVKLALTELYEKIKLESPSNLNLDKINSELDELKKQSPFDTEEEFFKWWNNQKTLKAVNRS